MSRIAPDEHWRRQAPAGPGTETMATLFAVMAQRPALAEQSLTLLETAMRSGTVDEKLKELLAVRVSQVNHCHY
jgi:alkylhydroperoxidase family enzyme